MLLCGRRQPYYTSPCHHRSIHPLRTILYTVFVAGRSKSTPTLYKHIIQLSSQLTNSKQKWVAPTPNPENPFARTKSPIPELKPTPTPCTPTATLIPNLIQNHNPYIKRAIAKAPGGTRKSLSSTAPPVLLLMARPNLCIYQRCNITVRSLTSTQWPLVLLLRRRNRSKGNHCRRIRVGVR